MITAVNRAAVVLFCVLALCGSTNGELMSFNTTALQMLMVKKTPFPHIVVKQFVPPDVLAAVNRDFPPSLAAKVQLHAEGGHKKNLEEAELAKRGEIFGAFKQLLNDARSNELRSIFAQKLGINLRKAFTRITLRGYCDPCQGKIHVDAKIKLVSWLIYLEEEPLKGEHEAGNLRLLTGPELKDTVEVVPSSKGTLLAFKNSMWPKHGWHGFYPYTGPRRAIQVNYQTELIIPGQKKAPPKKRGRRRYYY
uniref:Prolyl 4-hydroxylase alpha subunit Fe(2+) 2OG dioxygenase domain-containing protein n=1 Tax=Pyramimonas obovata TaxID=1411642 RepID=A0A7S0RPB1_9CHLO|mmetsp:Transcript_38591/g.83923  ORF Transcript_38591/g.83923 Transcript_38591/m.83923 type:complete len:250 (+) Transcript_38591:177-926(+)